MDSVLHPWDGWWLEAPGSFPGAAAELLEINIVTIDKHCRLPPLGGLQILWNCS